MSDFNADVLIETIGTTTMVPLADGMTYYAMGLFGGFDMATASAYAVFGALIGSAINYAFGFGVYQIAKDSSTLSADTVATWRGRMQWLVFFVGLFSWLHMVGVLVGVCGFMRVSLWRAALAIFIGQALYFAYQVTEVFPLVAAS